MARKIEDFFACLIRAAEAYMGNVDEGGGNQTSKKGGFHEEGRLKNHVKVGNHYIDDILMALFCG